MLIEKLERQSGVHRSKLLYLSATASKRYKVYDIPKRNGGHRRIAHPSKTLKAVQRWITSALISEFPIHQCATAYQKGSSIRYNALKHSETSFTLRMDFKQFFPSFLTSHLLNFFSDENAPNRLELSSDDLGFLVSVLTRNGAVTIGAPSSPALTNAMMYKFDRRVFRLAQQAGVIYTRYADDLFVSARAPDVLGEVRREIERISAGYRYANLRLNHSKTAYLSKRYRRIVTGLVITSDGYISLGRERKREIKAMLHRYTLGELENSCVDRVRGTVAFVKGSDSRFFASLQKKYGNDTIARLLGRL